MSRHLTAAVAGAASLLLLGIGSSAADASADRLQRQVDYLIRHSAPGARQIAPNRVQFFHYRTYNLSAYGMPPFTHRGASSYDNHQTGGAKAILHADFDFSMRGYGNLYGALNDRGRSITLAP